MEGCAFGPCRDSVERGGNGCHMCDVVTPGKVTYRTAWQRGMTEVTVASITSAERASRRETALTKRQAKKSAVAFK